MSSSDKILRQQLIRLANTNPNFRKDLLPIITASHKVGAGTYQDYVERKKKEGKPPLKKDEWEAKTQGRGKQEDAGPKKDEKGKDDNEAKKERDSTPTPVDKKLGDLLAGWHSSSGDPIYIVSSNAASGKPIPRYVVEHVIHDLDSKIKFADRFRISPDDVKDLTKAKKLLEKAVTTKKQSSSTNDEFAMTAFLRKEVIRLAHQHPEFRKDLLPLVKQAEFPAESIGDQVTGPTGGPGSDAKKPWSKGEFTQQENVELDEKQEKGQLSDGKADPVGKSASADDFATRAFRMARKAGKSQNEAFAFAKKAKAIWKA